ncbi:DUF3630 family protein [Alteromonas sp. 1_MG-2023]|jgi:hypothetical protein|uniref:DUF3630 family protein n=1 Tax=Alteromonas sp. 1_MG-2023 TaxID=3062669 RepID=UPI0026E1B326|nr:DUF3630 family protein [Alteromonas sp. 1_MG-2023]MDO6566622.1 DUF3630 family protein [Alteromonas sp. 1_MG-2023]
MQQLTIQNIKASSKINGQALFIDMPLPSTPLKAQQWEQTFCSLFSLNATNQEWGADRYQVTLSHGSFSCMMFIEWLCEAIWLEPIGSNENAHDLYEYLFNEK